MSVIALILLVALLIPIMGIVLDSPIGRALARRLEGAPPAPPALNDLVKKVDTLEAEVEQLNRTVESLQEETAFLHRLLADPSAPSRSTLPPPSGT
jgi:hypothetical protein